MAKLFPGPRGCHISGSEGSSAGFQAPPSATLPRPVQPHCPGQPGTQSLQPSRPTLSLAPRSTPSALQTAPPVPVLSQRRTVPGWGFLHCCSGRAQPALRGSGHRPLTGTQGLQIASQDFSFLESSLQGTSGPWPCLLGLLQLTPPSLPRGAHLPAAAHRLHPAVALLQLWPSRLSTFSLQRFLLQIAGSVPPCLSQQGWERTPNAA